MHIAIGSVRSLAPPTTSYQRDVSTLLLAPLMLGFLSRKVLDALTKPTKFALHLAARRTRPLYGLALAVLVASSIGVPTFASSGVTRKSIGNNPDAAQHPTAAA